MFNIKKEWYESKDVQELIAAMQRVLDNHGLTKITFESGYEINRYFDKDGKQFATLKSGNDQRFHLVKVYDNGTTFETTI